MSIARQRGAAPVVLASLLALSTGCMMPMHWPHKEEPKAEAAKAEAQELVATLKRVEELLSAQRMLAALLQDSPEKQELLARLDRMKAEVGHMIQSREAKWKPAQETGMGGSH